MGGNGLVALNGGQGGIFHLDLGSAANGNDPFSSVTGTINAAPINVLSGLNLGSTGVVMLAIIGLVGLFIFLKN